MDSYRTLIDIQKEKTKQSEEELKKQQVHLGKCFQVKSNKIIKMKKEYYESFEKIEKEVDEDIRDEFWYQYVTEQ